MANIVHVEGLRPQEAVDYCYPVMQQVLQLSQSDLKIESPEKMAETMECVDSIHAMAEPQTQQRALEFRMHLSTKYMKAATLPLRLFGWDQIPTILDAAQQARHANSRYIVEGSGEEEVDGEYSYDDHHDAAPKYVKEENGKTFTLFRCAMKDQSKQWFISIVDPAKPGTAEDVDYYSNLNDSVEPPLTGWKPEKWGGKQAPRLSSEMDQQLTPEERSIVQWVHQEHILAGVLGNLLHREVVSRSTSLVCFLAKAQTLEFEVVQRAWELALHKDDESTQDALLSMLAEVGSDMSAPLLSQLLALASLSLKAHSPRAGSNVRVVASFAEMLGSLVGVKSMLQSGQEVTQGFLQLLWGLNEATLSAEHQSQIRKLLHEAFAASGASEHRYNFLCKCFDSLKQSAAVKGSQRDESYPVSVEQAVLAAVEMVGFILQTYKTEEVELERTVIRLEKERHVVQLLFQELESLRSRSQQLQVDAFVMPRLLLLRLVLTAAPQFQFQTKDLNQLWVLLRGPEEQEAMLHFLNMDMMQNLCSPDVLEWCFRELICQQAELATIGLRGFDCFKSFFVGLSQDQTDEKTRTLNQMEQHGLAMLWNLVVSGKDRVNEAASQLLFSLYESHMSSAAESQEGVCDHFLTCALNQLESSTDSGRILRVLCLVQRFVACDGVAVVGDTQPHLHCARGKPFKLAVTPKSVNNRQPRSPSSLLINTHTKERLGTIRHEIAVALQHPVQQIRLTVGGRELVDWHLSLEELRVDGSEPVCAPMFAPSIADSGSCSHTRSSVCLCVVRGREDYYQALFSKLEACSDPKVSAHCWDLLMSIPTRPSLLQAVCSSANNWAVLLSKQAYYHTVYAIQVIDAQLAAVSNPLQRDPPEMKDTAVEFCERFIEQGGFGLALQFFLDLGLDRAQLGQSAMLQVVQTCVGRGQQQSIEQVPQLMGKLVDVLGSTDQTNCQAVLDIVTTIQQLVFVPQGDSRALTALLNSPSIEANLIGALINSPHSKVRATIGALLGQTLVSLYRPSTFEQVVSMLTAMMPAIQLDSERSREYFDLTSSLVHALSHHAPVQAEHCKASICQLAQCLYEQMRRHKFDALRRVPLLIGQLHLLTATLEARVEVEPLVGVVREIFHDYLFALPTPEQPTRTAVCSTPEARRSAYVALRVAVEQSAEAQELLMGMVWDVFRSVPEAVHFEWESDPQGMKRSVVGFGGLKNHGCTCYINAVLQQLFMVPSFRAGITCGPPPILPQQGVAQQGSLLGKTVMWGPNHSTGLLLSSAPDGVHTVFQNDGATMCRTRVGELTGVMKSPKEWDDKEKKTALLYEVRRCFHFLLWSEMQWYDPKHLVDSCNCLNLEFNVFQQNDASEFCDKLLDCIEGALEGSCSQALKQNFGGTLASQKILKEGHAEGQKKEKEQEFIKVELEVRGKPSIYHSLADFTKGELMDGDNKVHWEDLNGKFDTLNRTVFARLPNLLILHLKRFDFDFNLLETVKLNSHCSFPKTLYMKPFTREGIAEQEASGQCAPVSLDEAANAVRGIQEADMDPEYKYALQGVVIHAGSAQGGHYFSLVRNRQDGKWYKFDDETVTPFDEAELETACFGGRRRVSGDQGRWRDEQEMISNAFMLFYEKSGSSNLASDQDSELSVDDLAHKCKRPRLDVAQPEPLIRQALESNRQFLRCQQLFDSELHLLLFEILDRATPGSVTEDLIQMGMQLAVKVVQHSRDKSLIPHIHVALGNLLGKQQACGWLVSCAANNLAETLLRCPNQIVRFGFLELVLHACEALVSYAGPDAPVPDPVASLVLALVDFMRLPKALQNNSKPCECASFYDLVQRLASISPSLLGVFASHDTVKEVAGLTNTQNAGPILRAIEVLLGKTVALSNPRLFDSYTLSLQAQERIEEMFDRFALPVPPGGEPVAGRPELRTLLGGPRNWHASAGDMPTERKVSDLLTGYSSDGQHVNKEKFVQYCSELAASNPCAMLSMIQGVSLVELIQFSPGHGQMPPLREDSFDALLAERMLKSFTKANHEQEYAELLSYVCDSCGTDCLLRMLDRCVHFATIDAEMTGCVATILSVIVGSESESTQLCDTIFKHERVGLLTWIDTKIDQADDQGRSEALRLIDLMQRLHRCPGPKRWLEQNRASLQWLKHFVSETSQLETFAWNAGSGPSSFFHNLLCWLAELLEPTSFQS